MLTGDKEELIMTKPLNVLILNGSPRKNGNTSLAIREMEQVFAESGVQAENTRSRVRRPGLYCLRKLLRKGKCVFDDIVNELAPKFEAADGLVIASPVYYASANATLIACLDRLFYSTPFDKTNESRGKRRMRQTGGCSATV